MEDEMNDTREYSGHLRFETLVVSNDEARGTMPVQEGVLNPFGTVHAGALVWFADVVATRLALQGASVSAGGQGFPLAINITAQILSNVTSGILTARARFVKKGRTLQVVRTEVTSDQGKQLLDLTTSHITSK
ncbi:PaaI protein [Pseudooceanicola batsensis HTCC2597]|uniref:PaaI protein n=2 Tax=Pseudooceanicola batsensis TaxID=314255 RepID=A3TWK3_PSEBH|nr:PaaI protein [Pseudooceanicola batsensis HTCC2597]